ncbi:nicotinamide riboside transporter PnuC [Limnobaculum parvum]|uniref:Nicotinamide riboside transporter PnuC n=1 Tax=Limnobaculum parvum TaxID=2172103 RepID=A0A2Y9TXW7_9GAMM|nr:nicotinamide riboside transporter PnuC [Limnobaculum parvum]AWH88557.1 nicotinamide riboside transporter PnuC [Limnobaculum parvum]
MSSLLTLKNWRTYELVWLATFSTIAIVLTILWRDSGFGLSVFLTGVFCVVLAAKGHIYTYIFGMYNTLGYAYLSWINHLNGEVALNLLFFVPMNIFGFMMWKKKMNGHQVEMRSLSCQGLMLSIAVCIVGSLAVGVILAQIPKQNTPYIDATTVVLSIVATLLMVWRYKEQWLTYIVLNIFTIIIWIYRFVHGAENSAMMIVMWSAFLLNAIYGYWNWHQGTKKQV